MQKRGLSQVDWAISLAIFLLYIAWFFIYVRPIIFTDDTPSSLAGNLYDKFNEEFSWSFQKAPLYVKVNSSDFSQYSLLNEPVIAIFPYSWEEQNISLSGNMPFALDEGRIVFQQNLSYGQNIFWIVYSSQNLSNTYGAGIIANENFASTSDAKFEFLDYSLSKIYYKEDYRITGATLLVNDALPDFYNSTLHNATFYSKYKRQSQALNQSTYVFSGNNLAYILYELGEKNLEYHISSRYSLFQYPFYFASNSKYGEIDYEHGSCESFTHDYIDFYDDSGGISFVFKENASLTICSSNTSLTLDIVLNMTNESVIRIYPHDGNYTNTLTHKNPVTAVFGMNENLTGLKESMLLSLNEMSYSELKNSWSYPNERDFSITVLGTNRTVATFGESPPEERNVYVISKKVFILHQNGYKEPSEVDITTW